MNRFRNLLLIFSLICSFVLHSQTLTLAFSNIGTLERKSKLYRGEDIIGEVRDIWSNKNVDTIFVKIKLKKGVKIPVQSDFFIKQQLLGNENVSVKFSENQGFYSSKEIIPGRFNFFKIPAKPPDAINLIVNFPLVGPEGQLFNLLDTITIASCGNFLIYKLPALYSYTNAVVDREGNIISEVVEEKIKFNYFVQSSKDSIGLWYDSVDAKTFKLRTVSEALKNRAYWETDLPYLSLMDTNDSLVKVEKLTDDISIEKYVPKVKFDESYNDTTFMVFSEELKTIKYSLSEKADSIKNKKLLKISIWWNKAYSDKYKITMPQREYSFKIETVILTDDNEMMEFIKRNSRLCVKANYP